VAGHEFQSITGNRAHWFSAANDEGTPFDITKSGGYITNYSQFSQEFRVLSEKGKIVDYLGGLYYLTTKNDSLTRTRYGSDAGAYQANDTLYNSLAVTGGAAGQALLRDSLDLAYKGTQTFINNKSLGAYAKADWHLTEPLTLTTGYRFSQDNRQTSQSVLITDPGVGADLTTAFGTSSTTTGLVGGAASTAAADALARRYFGATATWASIGATNQNLLRNAARVRNGTLSPGSTYAVTKAPDWNGNVQTLDLALTHKFSDDLSLIGSVQYGEKPGMAQIGSDGKSVDVKKERNSGYELGLRASTPNKALLVNANVFLNDIRDFQTTINAPDAVQTAINQATTSCVGADCQAFTSRVGNLPGVRVRGLEVDAAYTGVEYFTFRIAAAYNDAFYSRDTYLALPNEQNPGTLPASARYYNAKGDTLNNAPKITAKLGIDYSRPAFSDKLFHASANYAYSDGYTTSTASSYENMPAYGLLDLGIGIGRRDGVFDINLIAKNVLNEDAHPIGWDGYTPRLPRWIGVIFSTKL
jgi:outer membrane receptor protein involved in Fe transport